MADDDLAIHIPANLQALITARIDRLDEPARRTLQLAALIGRSFYLRVLQAIAERELAVERQMAVLQRADLIHEIARIPEREYNFRHILTQEAAYATILRKERRSFHRRVAEAIEKLFPDQLAQQAVVLAWHHAEAGNNDRALHYYALAGHAAYRLYAIPESLTHYNRAVALAGGLDLTIGTLADDLLPVYSNRGRALELELDFEGAVANYDEMVALGERLGDPRFCLAGWLAEATIRATFVSTRDPALGKRLAENALVLARQRGDVVSEVRALWNLLLVDSFRGSSRTSLVFGEEGLAICSRYEDDPESGQEIRELKAVILTDLFRPYLFGGQIQRALELNDEAQALLRAQGNLPQLATSLINRALAYFELGRFDGVRAIVAEADRVSRSIGNVGGEVGAGFLMSLMFIEEGRGTDALAAIDRYIALGEQVGQVAEIVLNRVARGWLLGLLGKGENGLPEMEAALNASPGIPFLHTQFLAQAAQVALWAGQVEQAAAWIAEAEAQMNNDFWFFTSLYVPWVSAEIALAQGRVVEAISGLEALLERMQQVGSRVYLYDVHFLYGQALAQAGRRDGAIAALRAGLTVADEVGARRVRWRLLRRLADLIHDENEAQCLRAEAQADIDWLLAELPTQELRSSFLTLTEAML